MRIWRNWQTRTVQVRVRAISCRFKSCYPHQKRRNAMFKQTQKDDGNLIIIKDPIVLDYLSRLGKIRPDLFKNGTLKDQNALRRLCNLTIEKNNSVKTAQTILHSNKIIIGENAEDKEILLFHELEHIRKGTKVEKLYPYEGYGLRGDLVENKINLLHQKKGKTVFYADDGLFFDEAITEMIAQCLALEKDKSKITHNYTPARKRYGHEIKILINYANVLDLNPIDLCVLLEERMFHGDMKIDKLSKRKGLDFKKIERGLDPIATIFKVDTLCENKLIRDGASGRMIEPDGCNDETINFAKKQEFLIEQMIAHVFATKPSKTNNDTIIDEDENTL